MTEQEASAETPFDEFFDDMGDGDFSPLPIDDYQVTIDSYEIRPSKSGKMAHFTYKVTGDDLHDGRLIWDNAALEGESKGKLWRLKSIILGLEKVSSGAMEAIGLPPYKDEDGGFYITSDADVEMWLDRFKGRQVQIKVKHKLAYIKPSEQVDETKRLEEGGEPKMEAYIDRYIR